MIHSFIITGFLGVGKSSMLTNTVKNHFSDKNVAIVVNEFGEIGVDQNILKNVHSDVIEISEGCICCEMSQEFESGVIEIINKYKPEILFVETSGAAEPFPVFLSLQNLGISVEGVISVVDAKNYDSYMHNPTAKYQVGGSNIIVLNKTDLVTDEELNQAQRDIITYKERHDIKNTMTGKKVFNNYFIHHAKQGILPKDVFEGVYQIDEIIGLVTDDHHHEHHHDAIDRRVGKFNKAITFNDLDVLLKSLPKNIYRVKGMVKVEDVPTPLIVNYAFGNVSFEELADYDGESALVFIGEDTEIDLNLLENTFNYLSMIQDKHQDTHEHHDHEHSHAHHHD
ncbi:MAG: Putative metal chaperone, involved in Zn homeostasis, GTPase of COG0523 family [uncultured Sulfurovum sp.]|uniref:Metal chaperone, involved in Zn homeostasis, GTPase of COG0523 family n=1 Tax=uncultured Sulfurovum sp. TaxID=269237 RepID=A0A6S6TPT7_9BACT|nr:MAG: Putative metal chaperone, involved in Zn homeostasis, GTPase of COG0523 family [uncultured Sulfurovum sp.]